jgi:hypothetical protein
MAPKHMPSALQDAVKDRMATQLAMQREIQMAVAIAQARCDPDPSHQMRWNLHATNVRQARDGLMWFGGLWTTIVTTVTVAKAAGKPVPAVAAIPIVMGGFMLTNMCVASF